MLDRRPRRPRLERPVDPRRVEREVLADAAVVDGDPGVLADEVLLLVGDQDVAVDRLQDPDPRHRRLAVARRRERVAEILRNVLQRPHVQVRGGLHHRVLEAYRGRRHGPQALAFSDAALPARRPKTTHSSRQLPIMRLRPCVPPAISPQAIEALERGLGVLVDHETAVLVVQHRVREERLGQRVDARAAVAAQHVRQRDLGVGLGDAGRVEPHRRPSVLGLDAASRLDLVEDRLRDDVARAERVGELLAVRVQEHGAVGARRLGDRVPLHRRGPGAAVRVVLERVEVARLGAGVERDPRHLAGRVRVVRRELAARRAPPRSSGRRRRARRSPASIVVGAVAASRTSRASPAPIGSRRGERGDARARASRLPPRGPRGAPS